MAISVVDSGTQATTVGSWVALGSTETAGSDGAQYLVRLDCNAIAVGESLDVQVKSRAYSGATERVVFEQCVLIGSTTEPLISLPEYAVPPGATFGVSVRQRDGSSRTIAWALLDTLPAAGGGGGTTAADVWNYLTSAATTSGSIGKLVADYLDEAVSSRLASSGYTAPANADIAAIKSTVDTNLNATVSSRLATSGYTTPPTAAANASAVRTNLATELGRIDAAVSSRLASSGYTAPANADVAAIRAKTDNLPGNPAAVGSAMTLASNAVDASALKQDAADKIAAATVAAELAALDGAERTGTHGNTALSLGGASYTLNTDPDAEPITKLTKL